MNLRVNTPNKTIDLSYTLRDYLKNHTQIRILTSDNYYILYVY